MALLHAGDSFGELGLHDRHDHEKLNSSTNVPSESDYANCSTRSGVSGLPSSPKHSKKGMQGRRNASIVCREDCELLVIRREEFLSVLSCQNVHFNPQRAREVVMKKASDRTEEDIRILVELCEGLHFFSQIPSPLIRKCCEHLTLETYKPSNVVFEQSSVGDAMYIVLSGFLELDVASGGGYHHHHGSSITEQHEKHLGEERERDDDVFRRLLEFKTLTRFSHVLKSWAHRARERIAERSSTVSLSENLESETFDTLSSSKEGEAVLSNPSRKSHLWSGVNADLSGKGRDSYGTAVCVFKSGDAFGEMALLEEKGVRNGTVICEFLA